MEIQDMPTTIKKPQENTLIERVHLSMADTLKTVTFEGEG